LASAGADNPTAAPIRASTGNAARRALVIVLTFNVLSRIASRP
jgi:hypothetical protein